MRLIGYFLLLLSTSAFASLPLTGQKILILGESHMSIANYLIGDLPNDLVDQGAKVYSYGACGASAGDWLKTKSMPCSASRINIGTIRVRPADIATTKPVEKLMAKHHPNLILIIMGDTMASYDNKIIPKPWVWHSVSALTKVIKAHGTRCLWVGPAWGQKGGKYKKNNKRVKEFSDYLSTLVAPCTYIDSLTFSKIGEWKTFDGEHFDKWGYEKWARSITNAILSPNIISTLTRQKN
ncbi:MAG: SGNH/GDSL hydrolase family protein [Gallionella sp.]